MPGPLFAQSAAALKATLASQLGCDPAAFDSNALTIVERPEGSREHQLAIVATCGTGSVVSVKDPGLGDWAREQPLETHFRIFLPSFLEGMAAHARELGYDGSRSHSPSEGMVLAEDLPPRSLPAGYRMAELPHAEQERLRPGRAFENALGEPTELAKIAAIRVVFAATAPDGAVAGVAGIWDQYPGIDEIGLDVARAHRGLGLASALTIHATRWIRAQGRWPIYTYGVTNLRSMNNALSAGYRPLWLLSVVYVPDCDLPQQHQVQVVHQRPGVLAAGDSVIEPRQPRCEGFVRERLETVRRWKLNVLPARHRTWIPTRLIAKSQRLEPHVGRPATRDPTSSQATRLPAPVPRGSSARRRTGKLLACRRRIRLRPSLAGTRCHPQGKRAILPVRSIGRDVRFPEDQNSRR